MKSLRFQLRLRRRPIRHLSQDQRGATLVEFAFVVGPLLALLIATVQISLTFFAQQVLETASDKAVRQLITGTAQKTGMSQDQFKTLVCTKLPTFMKCAQLMVDVQPAASLNEADTSAPVITYDSNGNPNNRWSYTPGAAGQITIVRIMYVWDVQRGPLNFDLSTMSGGRKLLTAVSVFKTEPYS